MPTHANTHQRSPEHVYCVKVKYSYTSVQLCISGNGGRAHSGESRTILLGPYRFQVVPGVFQQYPVVRRMLTHANTPQRSPEHVNVLYDGGVATHQCSYAFQVLGAGHIQENPRRLVIRRMSTHANTPQRSPEHVNILYGRGGSYTSVQPCISGTGAGHIQGNVLNLDLNV